jgi:hypothetical protein
MFNLKVKGCGDQYYTAIYLTKLYLNYATALQETLSLCWRTCRMIWKGVGGGIGNGFCAVSVCVEI